jgi:hypothetical protein
VEDDLDRLHVGGHNDELADASVEGFGGFVGAARPSERAERAREGESEASGASQ